MTKEIKMTDIVKYVSCMPELCVKNGVMGCDNCPFNLDVNQYIYISKIANR